MARRRQSAAVIREVKIAVRARDGFRCVKCGMSESDHLDIYGQIHDVHRKTPGSPYTVADCVTLCRSCHGPEPISPRGSIDRSRGFTILLDIEHSEALLRFVAAQRVKPRPSVVVTTALEELLAKDGFWPPSKPPKPPR